MAERTRLTLIGGFLGAGKTTLINKLAERFISDRKRIGVITNDQGKYLIDTEFVKVRGIDVEEVTGSCFCCNFPKFFENVEKLSGEGSAEYILAEPVGSCTDLIATIMAPLSSFHGKEYSISPLIVLVDGTKMIDRSLDEATLGGYLRHHQVAEAEYLVLTKTDMLSSDAVGRFLDELQHINPFAKTIVYSAVTGEGLDEIVGIIDGSEETPGDPSMSTTPNTRTRRRSSDGTTAFSSSMPTAATHTIYQQRSSRASGPSIQHPPLPMPRSRSQATGDTRRSRSSAMNFR